MTNEKFIYLIQAVGTTRCKIGFTKNLETRLKALSRQAPYPLQLIAAYTTDKHLKEEKYWHHYYAEYLARGEWFEFPNEEFINEVINNFLPVFEYDKSTSVHFRGSVSDNFKSNGHGWLDQFTTRKRLSTGRTERYPKVNGDRDPNVLEHWYWAYRWEQKSYSDNRFITRAISIPRSKVELIKSAINNKWQVQEIIKLIQLGAC